METEEIRKRQQKLFRGVKTSEEYAEAAAQLEDERLKEEKEALKNFDFQASLKDLNKNALGGIKKALNEGNAQIIKYVLEQTGEHVEPTKGVTKFEPTSEDYQGWGGILLGIFRENWAEHGGQCPVCDRPKVSIQESSMDTGQVKTSQEDTVATLELSA